MKKLWLDLETTGLTPSKHSIIQIAGIVEIDGETIETFCLKSRPLPGSAVSNKALEVVKVSIDELKKYPEPSEIKQHLIDLFIKYIDPYDKKDKFQLVGYNAKFDYDFFRAWFDKQNYSYFGSFFWFPPIDVMNLVAYKVMGERHNMVNFKLFQVCKYFGLEIDEEKLHDAMYDIEITKQLYERIAKKSA